MRLRFGQDRILGTIAVAAIAGAIALIIVRLSHRNPVNAANVNKTAAPKPLPVAAAA